MRTIDVTLVGVTGIARDIVTSILDEDPDIRVTGTEAAATAATADADVVILEAKEGALTQTVHLLLARRPQSKVLAIRDDGRTMSLYELRPHETELGQISPQTLLEAVRAARTTVR